MTGEKQYTQVAGEFKLNPMYQVPNKVVSSFFQSWEQPLQERVDALNEAIELAGFKGTKAEVDGDGWTINGPQESEELFKQFYVELKACFPKGQFEWEEEAVRQVIAKVFQLKTADLKRRKRDADIVEARQVAMYVLCMNTKYSLTYIGQEIGGRSPSTVSHGFNQISVRIKSDLELKQKVDKIQQLIAGK